MSLVVADIVRRDPLPFGFGTRADYDPHVGHICTLTGFNVSVQTASLNPTTIRFYRQPEGAGLELIGQLIIPAATFTGYLSGLSLALTPTDRIIGYFYTNGGGARWWIRAIADITIS